MMPWLDEVTEPPRDKPQAEFEASEVRIKVPAVENSRRSTFHSRHQATVS